MKPFLSITLFVTVLVGLGACVSAPSKAPLEVPLELPAAVPALDATVTRVIDTRPEATLQSRVPHIESHYSVLLIASGGVFVDGARIEGPSHHGDETLRFVANGARKSSVEAVEDLVAALAGGGRAPVDIDTSLARQGMDRLVASLPTKDGWVLVPFLDQLDVSALSSNNSMVGGSSSETGRSATTVTTTTTSGAASLAASVGGFANARVRLLAVELRGGRAVRRVWVHGRGVGPDLGAALRGLATTLTEGLQEVSR
jgi:hypothetical protein